MSLRQWRSWMPARKSRASRIIGERAVRSIAASTSASAEASVPSHDLEDDRVGASRAARRRGRLPARSSTMFAKRSTSTRWPG